MPPTTLALAAAAATVTVAIVLWRRRLKSSPESRATGSVVKVAEISTTPSAVLTLHRAPSYVQKKLTQDNVKIVYLVRHAQAEHNVQEKAAEEAAKARGGDKVAQEKARKQVLNDTNFLDAALSTKGQAQASSSQRELESLLERTHYPKPECVLVSPLQRTLHTASLLFPKHAKMEAHERLREKRTGLPCDERRPATEAAAQFPHISFATIAAHDATSDDGYVFRPELGEGNAEVDKRAATLLELLRHREERGVAVVTHKGFLRELNKGTLAQLAGGGVPAGGSALSDDVGDHSLTMLDPIFGNAEVRVLEIAFPLDPTVPPAITLKALQDATDYPSMHTMSSNERNNVGRASEPLRSRARVALGCSSELDAASAARDAWRQVTISIRTLALLQLTQGCC